MEQNVIVTVFDVESEAYQAMTELKNDPGDRSSLLTQAALVKKEGGTVRILDSFDTGADTLDDMAIGGIVGSFVGILGGPVGVLLGGSMGAMMGSGLDAADAVNDASMMEQVAGKLADGDVVIIGLANEEAPDALDAKLSKFKTTIMRYDAAVIAQEVEEARLMQREMERQAREQLRKQRSDEFKSKVEEHRNKIKAQFEGLAKKFDK